MNKNIKLYLKETTIKITKRSHYKQKLDSYVLIFILTSQSQAVCVQPLDLTISENSCK